MFCPNGSMDFYNYLFIHLYNNNSIKLNLLLSADNSKKNFLNCETDSFAIAFGYTFAYGYTLFNLISLVSDKTF
ncbi:MAG: hypothetical protein LBM96_08395 [Methanobrevibacter sp.]|nr:hypothetical protein [Candidatus Methanoflexus mossambicus]